MVKLQIARGAAITISQRLSIPIALLQHEVEHCAGRFRTTLQGFGYDGIEGVDSMDALLCKARRSNLEGITSDHWFYGWSSPKLVDKLKCEDFLHGFWPNIVAGSPCPTKHLEKVQRAIDLVCEDPNMRLNPSIISIPAISPLSALAVFIGVVRVSNGLKHYGRPYSRLNNDTIIFSNLTTNVGIGDIKTQEGEIIRSCELVLLDKDFHTIAQVPIFEAGSSNIILMEDYRCGAGPLCHRCSLRSSFI